MSNGELGINGEDYRKKNDNEDY
jgi:hypothetical protein